MHKTFKIFGIGLLFILSGCGSYFNQPVGKQDARFGELTKSTKAIRSLPEPESKVVVGVYNFKDQTGQYKPTEVGSTFSTAVTQGATTILIKALEDSKWFRPIERENLSNLLQERKIIDATRRDYSSDQTAVQKLAPLLFAGVILEGGIVSYDSNILTGGIGARYFGVGGSTQYRQDRITIYLRAVSTATGEVLKTVYVSKTILSQGVDAGVFRYVNFQRLLEAETGYTKNEPAELAVKEAIEKAVESLVYEGIKDSLWSTKGGEEENKAVTEVYLKEKQDEEAIELYDRRFHSAETKHSVNAAFGMSVIDGDLASGKSDFSAKIGYKYHFSDSFRFGLDLDVLQLNSGPDNNYTYIGSDLNLEYRVLPRDEFSPYVYGGAGFIAFADTPSEYLQSGDVFGKFHFGFGLEYQASDKVSVFLQGDYNLSFSDKIDNVVNGKRDDYYFNFNIGVNYKLGL
jgi:curli production assembly/transport component CsgG